MKKIVALMFVLSLVLVGCSGQNAQQEVNYDDIAGTTVTIGVWKGNDGEEAALDQLIADFEAETGATVEKVVYTDYATQLSTELYGGNAPDAFYVDSSLAPTLIDDGALYDLTPYMSDTDIADFYPAALAAFQDDSGNVYALPKDYSTLGVYYNEDLLAAAGFTPEDIPTTLEEYPAFLTELQANLPEGVVAMANTNDLERTYTWLQVGGASVVTEDGLANFADPAVVANAQIILDLNASAGYEDAQTLGYSWGGDAFGAGAAAMTIEGPWLKPLLELNFPDLNYGIATMPTYKGEANTPLYTVGWGVNSNAENLEGAIAWTLFATGEEGMNTWCTLAGLIPSRDSVAQAMDIESDPAYSVFADEVDYATVWQIGPYTSLINDEYNNVIPTIVDGSVSIEQGYQAIDDSANSAINAGQ